MLPPRLVDALDPYFPGSKHVSQLGLSRHSDHQIWTFAHEHQYHIMTKDRDFLEIMVNSGFPPKIIWLRMSNQSSDELLHVILSVRNKIKEFIADPKRGLIHIQ